MKGILGDARGFSLVEMLVGIGILTIMMGTIGTAMYQGLGTQQGVVEDGTAINELRKGFGWLAADVKMAQTSTLVDLAPPVDTVTFTWTDHFNGAMTAHISTYSVVGGDIVRTFDSQSHAIARDVVSAEFSLDGRTVTAEFVVNAGAGTTRTLSVWTLMRSTAP